MALIYIIEDEPPAAEKLKLFVMRAEPESTVQIYHDGLSAWQAVQQQVPDIIFTDIEMPGLNGIELIERLPAAMRPPTIVTSAYEKYALSGFQLSVTDYLLKPYSYARFTEALSKAHEAIRLKALDRRQAERPTLSIRTDLRTEKVEVDQILYVESVKDYVRIVTPAKRMLTQQTLTAIESLLPADKFMRVHRSYLINMEHVTAYDANSVTLTDNTVIAVGKTYKARFNEMAKTLF